MRHGELHEAPSILFISHGASRFLNRTGDGFIPIPGSRVGIARE